VSDQRGATTVELVLVLPAFMLLVLLALQFGMVLYSAQVVEAAAQEAVEAGRGEVDIVRAGETRARQTLDAAAVVRQPRIEISRSGTQVAAHVRGLAPKVVPFVALPVQARASAVVERFVPEDERP
jgi:Flp pilus assembly protein TadG